MGRVLESDTRVRGLIPPEGKVFDENATGVKSKVICGTSIQLCDIYLTAGA